MTEWEKLKELQNKSNKTRQNKTAGHSEKMIERLFLDYSIKRRWSKIYSQGNIKPIGTGFSLFFIIFNIFLYIDVYIFLSV